MGSSSSTYVPTAVIDGWLCVCVRMCLCLQSDLEFSLDPESENVRDRPEPKGSVVTSFLHPGHTHTNHQGLSFIFSSTAFLLTPSLHVPPYSKLPLSQWLTETCLLIVHPQQAFLTLLQSALQRPAHIFGSLI